MRGGAGTFRRRTAHAAYVRRSRVVTGCGLAMNLDLIGDDVAVSLAHWIDFGDREAPVAQLGQSFLERVVKIVLESRRLFGRRENPRINAIRLLGIFFGAGYEFDFRGRSRQPDLRLIMKPARRRAEHEN